MRRIHKISTAAALAISIGAAVSAAISAPSAQAQTIAMTQAKQKATPAAANAGAAKPTVGVDLYVNENYSISDVQDWGARDLKYIRDGLGLKAVSIDWDYNVPSMHSNVVEASKTRTPTIAAIRDLTNIAKSDGLRVEYRVLFAVADKDSRDGSISPKNLNDWLGSLYRTETGALKLADQERVPGFVVGSEMASIDKSPDWSAFFKKAAKIYPGSLSYASYGGHNYNDGGFFSASRVALPTADLGATAYPAIALEPNTKVDVLTRAWENYLTAHTSAATLRRTAIEEIGIPALPGSYLDPWQWDNLSGTADQTIQRNWFEAACRAVTAEHMRGIYFWSFALNDDPAKPYSSLVGFLGRPQALNAIKSC
jgi:hypothetical protein